jgi:hypothetical protein
MTPAAVKASYRRALDRYGEPIYIRRFSGPVGPNRTATDYGPIQARVTGFQPDEFIGSIVPGDRKIVAMAADIDQSGITLPVTAGADKALWRGRELTLKAVDTSTRRISGVLVAYEMVASG